MSHSRLTVYTAKCAFIRRIRTMWKQVKKKHESTLKIPIFCSIHVEVTLMNTRAQIFQRITTEFSRFSRIFHTYSVMWPLHTKTTSKKEVTPETDDGNYSVLLQSRRKPRVFSRWPYWLSNWINFIIHLNLNKNENFQWQFLLNISSVNSTLNPNVFFTWIADRADDVTM